MIHIQDDFLFTGFTEENKLTNTAVLIHFLCEDTGVSIKHETPESARLLVTFMGLQLDYVTMEAWLSLDKLKYLRVLLTHYTMKRKITLKVLQSLLGLFNFCCSVIVPDRTFMRRLTDLTKKK